MPTKMLPLLALAFACAVPQALSWPVAPVPKTHSSQEEPRMQYSARSIGSHWKRADTLVDESSAVTYTISLHGANFSKLEARMEDIAMEGNGQWLSPNDLALYTTPHPSHLAHLRNALNASDIPSSALTWSPHLDRVVVKTDVARTQRLFPGGQPFQQFFKANEDVSSASNNVGIIRTHALAIPHDMAEYIQHVGGLTDFTPLEPKQHLSAARPISRFPERGVAYPSTTSFAAKPPTGCNGNGTSIDAICIQNTYAAGSYKPRGGHGLDVLIVGYTGTYVDPNDIPIYLSKESNIKAGLNAAPFIIDGIKGNNNASDPSLEGSLDTQLVVGQNYPLNNSFLYYEEDGSTFTDSLNYILDAPDLDPGVVSISFAADEQAFSESEANYLCNTIQKLTARGTTVVFASGDGGVASVELNTSCPSGKFLPTYPSGCRMVLSVGAVVGEPPQQRAASWSGGGFSNLFSTASYQKQAVQDYIDRLGDTVNGKANFSGRGYPDVSALGSPIATFQGGEETDAFGTSAATPIWAALLSLVNDARQSLDTGNGTTKGRVGYVHPILYNNSAALNDVQEGQSYGCGGDGFYASPGWDPVSGLGSPNLTTLMQIFGAV